MKNLFATWQQLGQPYTSDAPLLASYWQEIQKAYQSKGRHYHNLQHLTHLLQQAKEYQQHLQDYDTLCFSIFYHDIVYSSLRKDNEQRSAALARERLQALSFPSERIEQCVQQINATRHHTIPEVRHDPDLAYFLDFDLSILGSHWERYLLYTQQIREEYRIYPGWMYRKGRLKVLHHFLERERLFFTDEYFRLYEKRARENLEREVETLR